MTEINLNSVEVEKPIQQMNVRENIQSFGKVPKAISLVWKAIEKNNVLRNRMKSEIDATCHSPISCLNRLDLGYYSNRFLLFKN